MWGIKRTPIYSLSISDLMGEEAAGDQCLVKSVHQKTPHRCVQKKGYKCHIPDLLVLIHCILSSCELTQSSTRKSWCTLCFCLLTRFMAMLISFCKRTWQLSTVPKLLVTDLLIMVLLCLIDQPSCLT